MGKKNIGLLGRHPCEGKKLREEKRIMVITEEKCIKLLHGHKHQVFYQLAVSNDFLNEGLITILPKSHSETDVFVGDSIFIPLDGSVSFTVEQEENDEKKNVSNVRFEVNIMEKFFLPAKTAFQIHNFSREPVRLIFAAASLNKKYRIGKR